MGFDRGEPGIHGRFLIPFQGTKMSLHRTAHDRMIRCLASGLVGLYALGSWLLLFPGPVARGADGARTRSHSTGESVRS